MLTFNVITEEPLTASGVVRVQDTVAPTVHDQSVPVAETAVKPVGNVSDTVIVPAVVPFPPLVTVNEYDAEPP